MAMRTFTLRIPSLQTGRPVRSRLTFLDSRDWRAWRGSLSAAAGLLVGACALGGAGCRPGDIVPDDSPPAVEPGPPPAAPDLGIPRAPDLAAPDDATLRYNHFFVHQGADLSQWTGSGVALKTGAAGPELVLSPVRDKVLSCAADEIDGGSARFDAAAGLCTGTDPNPTGTGLPAGVRYYNGDAFYYGTALSPEIRPARPITSVIASFAAATPTGTWIQLHVRAKLASGYSKWYPLPVWAADFSTVKRHSVKGAGDAVASVDVDTFLLKDKEQGASAYQLRVTLFSTATAVSPAVRRVAGAAQSSGTRAPNKPGDPTVWGTALEVPPRSQELPEYKGKGYGGGGEVWCSPTSTSMVMAYWSTQLRRPALNQTVPDAAAGCYDWVYNGTGNWPFNTAYASTLGLSGYVVRLDSLTQAEEWIRAGVPLIISVAWKPGELPGAPISQTNGHLIVLRGFDSKGDALVNDPAAPNNDSVQRVYPRANLEAAWDHSGRTAYAVFPEGHRVPSL